MERLKLYTASASDGDTGRYAIRAYRGCRLAWVGAGNENGCDIRRASMLAMVLAVESLEKEEAVIYAPDGYAYEVLHDHADRRGTRDVRDRFMQSYSKRVDIRPWQDNARYRSVLKMLAHAAQKE